MAPAAELLQKAVEHHRAGKLGEATALYHQILRLDPAHADALHLLGVAAHQNGDFGRAVEFIHRAVTANRSFAPYYSNLGAAYRAMGRLDKAIAAYRDALTCDPHSIDSHFNLGNALQDQGHHEEAAASYQRVLGLDSKRAEAWNSLGVSLQQLQRYNEAEISYRRAIALRPGFAEAHFSLGNVLRSQGRAKEAAGEYLRAASLKLDYIDAQINLGNAYEELGSIPQAIIAYERALRIAPDSPIAHFNRALAWLRGGNFARGWEEYEWRWRHNGRARTFDQPVWDGDSLANRTILIYGEQGIGDELLFSSCFEEVIDQAGRCLIECDPRLVRVFTRTFPNAHVFARVSAGNVTRISTPEPYDLQIAAGSLPRILRPTRESFPRNRPFLRADDRQVDQWRERFRKLGGTIVVGISWRGGKDPATRRLRSTTLDQWKSVLNIPGVRFVNLQYGDCRDDLDTLNQQSGITLHDWDEGNPLTDLDGFTARVAALDLVISVDNSTVHLAGSLGIPVWTLLPFAADWRWLLNTDVTPWYPTMKLWRQRAADCWPELFSNVAAALKEVVQARQLCDSSRTEAPSFPRTVANTNAEKLFQLGNYHQSQGQHDKAIEAYRHAIRLRPNAAKFHFNLANAFLALHRIDEARSSFARALEIDPSNTAQAYTNLGVVLRRLGRVDDAEAECHRALLADPDYSAAQNLHGQILQDRGDLLEAADRFRKAISLDARNHEAFNNLGTALQGLGKLDSARDAYEQAIAINPGYAEAQNNLGTVLYDLGDIDAALAAYRQSLIDRPDFPEALTNLGMALDQQGQGTAALKLLDRALILAPDSREAKFYRSIALLRQGRFEPGWREYESRWDRAGLPRRHFLQSTWDGTPLHERTLLIYGEQGVGDEVFFASCLPDVLQLGVKCLVECDARLVPLFIRSFPAAHVFAKNISSKSGTDDVIQSFDLQIAAGSLPRFFRNSHSDFPMHRRRFLMPDHAGADCWKTRLNLLGSGLKIGISWRGGSALEDRRRRSTTLQQWSNLLTLHETCFINLQYGSCQDELSQLHLLGVHHLQDLDPLRDLDNLASLLTALDLVISVDNATVHFAGALGVPVWILLPWESDWRWMRDRADSPWYPTARLFRQQRPGDWAAVFAQVAHELRKLSATGTTDVAGRSLNP